MKLFEIFDDERFRRPEERPQGETGKKVMLITYYDDDYYDVNADEEHKEVEKFSIVPIDGRIEDGIYRPPSEFKRAEVEPNMAFVADTPAKAFELFKNAMSQLFGSAMPRLRQGEYPYADRDAQAMLDGQWTRSRMNK